MTYDFSTAARERAVALSDLLDAIRENLTEEQPVDLIVAMARADEVLEGVDVEGLRAEDWKDNIEGNTDFLQAYENLLAPL